MQNYYIIQEYKLIKHINSQTCGLFQEIITLIEFEVECFCELLQEKTLRLHKSKLSDYEKSSMKI